LVKHIRKNIATFCAPQLSVIAVVVVVVASVPLPADASLLLPRRRRCRSPGWKVGPICRQKLTAI